MKLKTLPVAISMLISSTAHADLWICDRGGIPIITNRGDASCAPYHPATGSAAGSVNRIPANMITSHSEAQSPKKQPPQPARHEPDRRTPGVPTNQELNTADLNPALDIVRGFQDSANSIAKGLQPSP